MTNNIEGTIVLEGLLEGRLPHDDFETELRQWVTLVRQVGLHFQLDIDGNVFSLMPGNTPLDARQFSPDPAKIIAETVEQLTRRYEEHAESLPFSTLRSVENQKGRQVQTLYSIQGDRSVSIQQRTVDAETTEPEKPLNTKERVKLAVTGLMFALVVVAVTSLFVDYRAMWSNIRNAVTPLHPETMKVDATVFGKYITVKSLEKNKEGAGLVMTLERGEAYADVNAGAAQPEAPGIAAMSMADRMAMEAVIAGYIRCEYLSEKGEWISTSVIRIRDLQSKPKIEILLSVDPTHRPERLILTY